MKPIKAEYMIFDGTLESAKAISNWLNGDPTDDSTFSWIMEDGKLNEVQDVRVWDVFSASFVGVFKGDIIILDKERDTTFLCPFEPIKTFPEGELHGVTGSGVADGKTDLPAGLRGED